MVLPAGQKRHASGKDDGDRGEHAGPAAERAIAEPVAADGDLLVQAGSTAHPTTAAPSIAEAIDGESQTGAGRQVEADEQRRQPAAAGAPRAAQSAPRT